jgi:hypothetical protein
VYVIAEPENAQCGGKAPSGCNAASIIHDHHIAILQLADFVLFNSLDETGVKANCNPTLVKGTK